MVRATLVDEACIVRENRQVGPRLYVLEVNAPRIAADLLPGQFIHLQVPDMPDHLLRRPFSVYQKDAGVGTLSVLYQVVGYGTERLAQAVPGSRLQAIGPVGQHWEAPDSMRAPLLVGGGVGAAPLYLFAADLAAAGKQPTIVLGAQTKDALVTLDAYLALPGVHVVAATDDGSFGHAGFCTDPAQAALDEGADFVACCGPEVLMRIVAGMAAQKGVTCKVSMERRMACGVGACLSCVVDTTNGKKRACVDGPIFDAEQVVW